MSRKIYLALFALLLVTLISSCKKVEEENYTYSISKVWWSDSIDTNLDGYVQSKRLNFDVHLRENTIRVINARVYYKLHDASSFTFYTYAGEQNAKGGDTDNNLFVTIGKPNKELARNFYDFKIEIFEARSGRTVAVSDPRDSTLLTMQKFEASSNDKNYSIKTRWSESYDRNNNGYWRYARLNINVDIDTAMQKTVYAKLFYKNVLDNTYKLYHQFSDFTIFNHDTSDTVSYMIGSPTIELQNGAYDFKIEVYEFGSNILVAYADENTQSLRGVRFESEKDDSYHYSITKVWWSDQIDADGDGYTQYRKLNFVTEVNQNAGRTIYAKIFYLHPDSADYSLYDSTANYNIVGTSQSNNYFVGIGGASAQLDSAAYNFLISIYEPTRDTVEAFQVSISAADDSILAKQKFEPDTTDVKK